jgi:anti-anti-sigma regulatory factor
LVLSEIATQALSNRSTLSVIVSLEESVDLDSTGFDALVEFDTLLHKAGKRVYYARVHDWIRDLMESAGEAELASRCNFSVDDAVTQAAADAASPTE